MVATSADPPPPAFSNTLALFALAKPNSTERKAECVCYTHRVCYCVMHTARVTTPCVIALTACMGLSPTLAHY